MMSILVAYPDFRSLPQGIKKLLVVSENFFFGEARTAPAEYRNHRRVCEQAWSNPTERFYESALEAATVSEMKFAG
jgi:hypothetical protein